MLPIGRAFIGNKTKEPMKSLVGSPMEAIYIHFVVHNEENPARPLGYPRRDLPSSSNVLIIAMLAGAILVLVI